MLRKILPVFLAAALVAGGSIARAATAKPNIVIVFTDDQGYADVGVFGAEGFTTPNLDRLAAEGTKFSRFYVAQPVCSASRTALLTGCYSNRVGIHGALGPKARHGINASEKTLAELLKEQGYATAMFGKWHLGHHPQFLPTRHGFDEYFGIPYSNDMWPYHPGWLHIKDMKERIRRGFPPLPLIEGETIINDNVLPEDQKDLTVELTRRAVDFINREKDGPFFLYLAHPQPHVPLFASDWYEGTTERGLYGDVISEIDWSVGRVMDTLEANGLTDNTWIIYTSDNGPWLSYGDHGGSAKPLREGKGTVWEGGVREPCIMRWPGNIPAGKVVDTPVMTIDLLPTIAGRVGGELPEHPIDGRDVWPILASQPGAKNPHDAYWFYYKSNELHAVMSGDWKLYLPHAYRTLAGRSGGKGGMPVGYSQARTGVELYNLVADISEKNDVAEANPEVVKRLLVKAEKARAELGDSLTKRKGTGNRQPGRLAK